MKKILSALAICLILALCLGLAIAEDVIGESDTGYQGLSGDTPTRIHNGQLEKLVEIVLPTCTKDGRLVYECAWDPSLFHEIVWYHLGHSWEEPGYDWEDPNNYTEPDCLHRVYKCERCPETYVVDHEHHLWSSNVENPDRWGKIIKEPTCTSEGEAIDYCTREGCGVTRDKIRVIEKLDHNFTVICDVVEPYCVPDPDEELIVDGWYHKKCEYCGAYEEDLFGDPIDYFIDLEGYWAITGDTNYDGHVWDGKITEKEATCTAEGRAVRFCTRCGEKQIFAIPMIAHDFEETKTLLDCYTGVFKKTCKVCGAIADGYTEEGIVKDYLSHQVIEAPEYLDEERSVPATCTKDGYDVYKCIHWDETPEKHEAKTDAENIAEGALYVKKVEKLGHDWGGWVRRYEIGEGENKYAYYIRTCLRCMATEEKVSKYDEPECVGEHEWAFDETLSYEPECGSGEIGFKVFVCTKCGVVKEEDWEAPEHEFEVEPIKDPTCTEPGKVLKTCVNCKYEYSDVVAPTGHTPEKQDDGSIKCAVCGIELEKAPKNGFVVEDGVWKWYKDDVWQEDLTAIVTFDGAEFWVVKGVLPLDANGLINCPDGKFYFLSQGKIVRNSGFVEYLGQWFKIVNGELDLTYNGLFDYDGGKFLVAAGRWIQTVSGLWQNLDSKWYYLADGQVVAYSGVAEYNGRFFVVANGVLDTSYNGTIKYDGHTFEVVNGQLAEVPID